MTRFIYFVFLLSVLPVWLLAQPDNDQCFDAIRISDVTRYCSRLGGFTNVGATFDPAAGDVTSKPTCWSNASHDVWFRFVAIATDVLITVNGTTLKRPELVFYTGSCNNLSEIFPCISSPANLNSATLYKGGLVVGAAYYVRVDGFNDNSGTFQFCLNNFNPPRDPNADCITGTVLCSKAPFHVESVVGAGRDADEADNSCLDFNNSQLGNSNSESNSTWYKWTAANDGTLTFKITPDDGQDDIDFGVFELVNGLSICTGKRLIRCMATACLGPTGLNATSSDTEESPNCDPGEDGYVRQIDMIRGRSYGIMINNFTSTNHGFFIEFGGTGEFQGPSADFTISPASGLKCEQAFTLKDSSLFPSGQIVKYTWNFGEGAIPSEVNLTKGPHQVRYRSFGIKTIVLVVESDKGCTASITKTIDVQPCCEDLTALKIQSNGKNLLCQGVADGIISLAGQGGTPDYLFSFNNEKFKRQFLYTKLNKGSYIVKISDARGCRDSAVLTLTERPPVVVNAGPDLMGRLGYEVRLSGTYSPVGTASKIRWVPPAGIVCDSCLATDVVPPGSTEYKLVVTDVNGCVGADSVFIEVSLDRAIYIPNTFTPDRDSKNNRFQLFGNRAIESVEYFRVFDRWGGLVFERKEFDISDETAGWDGTRNGSPLAAGVYTYSSSVRFVDQITRIYKGDVTLYR